MILIHIITVVCGCAENGLPAVCANRIISGDKDSENRRQKVMGMRNLLRMGCGFGVGIPRGWFEASSRVRVFNLNLVLEEEWRRRF